MTEQQTDKATPRPWCVSRINPEIIESVIPTARGFTTMVADCWTGSGDDSEKANAAFIVEAANAYNPAREEKIKALVIAVKEVVRWYDRDGSAGTISEVIDTLRTALEAMEKAG